jgi:thiamine kinase-like enzyme
LPLSEKVHLAFGTWPEWRLALDQPPTIIRPLSSRKDNRHYLLNAGGFRLVLRINIGENNKPDVATEREYAILEAIDSKPFAPTVFYNDQGKDVLVTEFIEGYQWQPDDLSDTSKRDSLIELVSDIHAVKHQIPAFNYSDQLRRRWQKLLDSNEPFPMEALKMFRDLESALADLEATITQPVLCHHDLTPGNIIADASGQLKVMNWTNAGAGSPIIEAFWLADAWQNRDLVNSLLGGDESTHTHLLAQRLLDFYRLI